MSDAVKNLFRDLGAAGSAAFGAERRPVDEELWSWLAEDAAELVEEVQRAPAALVDIRERFERLIVRAQSQAELHGAAKVDELVAVWRATVAQIDRMISALIQAGPQ